MTRWALVSALLVCAFACARADVVAGTVQSTTYDWHDAKRDRDVPVRLYYPAEGKAPCPVIVFSHGLGGNREGYAYLGRAWASAGYVSVHVQHLGSDDAVWRGSSQPWKDMQAAAASFRNALERPRDVSFVLDQLEIFNRQPGPLRGRLDLSRVGMAGHSFGAHTTLVVAGQQLVGPLGRGMSQADPRIKAAIPMSAPVPVNRAQWGKTYGSIHVPCLHMTGTEDNSPIGNTKAAQRRVPFDQIHGATGYLVNFNGGDHMIFSGRPRLLEKPMDAQFQALIVRATTAFWDAYLKGDARAEAWLNDGGLAETLGKDATLEVKIGVSHPFPR